jgi:hypothetical protein
MIFSIRSLMGVLTTHSSVPQIFLPRLPREKLFPHFLRHRYSIGKESLEKSQFSDGGEADQRA